MKEADIRDKIKGFIDRFDRGVRKVVLPATLGVGLAFSSGCGPEDDLDQQPTMVQSGKSDNVALYAAPFPELDAGATKFDFGHPPVALYSAPFPGPDAGVEEADTGIPDPPVALYSAPFPGPDAAVEEADTGIPDPPVALYSAPFPQPDADVEEADAGLGDGTIVALYSAPFPAPDAG